MKITTVVELTVWVQIELDDNLDVAEVVNELDYDFVSQTEGARVVDMGMEWL